MVVGNWLMSNLQQYESHAEVTDSKMQIRFQRLEKLEKGNYETFLAREVRRGSDVVIIGRKYSCHERQIFMSCLIRIIAARLDNCW
jgi:hypothetical protein